MAEASQKRIALVTGASRGIGAQAAHALAKAGRTVVLASRTQAKLDEVAQSIIAQGGEAFTMTCDITDSKALTDLIDHVADRFGRLDILVNNAGMTHDGLILRMTDEQFDQVVSTNLRSVFIACRAALRPMMRGKFGRIVNIGSVSGLVGNAGQANYAAAKAGVIGLTRSIAKEMAPKGITANVVAPGFIETEMTTHLPQAIKDGVLKITPAGRFGQPEEVAAAIAFLSSDEAGYINGQVLTVDGGMTMA